MGAIRAPTPRISQLLATVLPTTLPSAMPGEPISAASTLATSSGVEVPKPTSVSQIISSDTPMRRATATAPRTRKSPPAASRAKPAISSR